MKNKIFILPSIYILIMAIGMTIMHFGFGYIYGSSEMMKIIFWVEILLSIFSIYAIKKYSTWKQSGFDNLSLKGFLWILPSFLIMGFFSILFLLNFKGPISRENLFLITLTGITTLLVGFSEELMFRGIMLNWSLKKYGRVKAILISSIGFSLLHSINILGGEPLGDVKAQMISTLLFGLFAGVIALKLKNIIPLMILHFLWDFSIFSVTTLSVAGNISTEILQPLLLQKAYEVFILIVVLIITLWGYFKRTD